MESAVLEAIRRRRTVRKFKDQDVADEQVEALLEAAMYAPSRLNKRPWHVVVVRDPETRRQIAEQVAVHSFLERAPVLLVAVAQPHVSPTWPMDVSAAIQNMLLAAEALGLGAVWVGAPGTVQWGAVEDTLRSLLAIPEDVRIAALVGVGHPVQEVAPHDKERHFDPTRIHYEKWGNLRDANLQEQYLAHLKDRS